MFVNHNYTGEHLSYLGVLGPGHLRYLNERVQKERVILEYRSLAKGNPEAFRGHSMFA